MRLGCSTLLYGGYSLAEALTRIKAADYDAIELAAIPGMAEHLSADGSGNYYREVRQRVEDAGLAIESVGASTNLLDPEKRTRFESLMRAAALLGAPAITTGPGGVPDDETSFAAVVQTVHELATIAAVHEVKISLKPHAGQAVYTTPTALRLLGEVDRTWVGINFDASHLYRADEDVVASLATLAPHLATCRIRDIAGKQPGPGPVENQIPGKGVLALEALVAAIRGLALPYVTLEIVGARSLPIEEVDRVIRESLAYLAPRLRDD